MAARTFTLQRDVDVTGVSGTGVVADGVEFDDDTVVIHWRGDTASTVVWSPPNAMAKVEKIHGHGGATRIVWDTDHDALIAEQ